MHNECVTVHMHGPLNVPALEASFNEIIRRHEAWRTTFENRDGQPVQVVHAATPVQLPVLDLRALPRAGRETAAFQKIAAEARQPFHLDCGPLLRPILVRIDETEHKLFLIAHQIIIDGMSAYQIFPSELAALYEAFSAGKPSPLPELPIQYADFACWQRDWLQGERLANQVDYWRRQLLSAPSPLSWPSAYPENSSFRGVIQPFAFPGGLAEELRELSRRAGATLFVTLAAALTWLLHTYTSREEVVVGTPSFAGRKRSEVAGLLGYFLNPVALRIHFRGKPSFADLLCQVRLVVSDALSHDDVPIEFLAREMKTRTEGSRNPFFRGAISLQPSMPDLDRDWHVTSMDVGSGGASGDLYLAFIERRDGLLGRAQYNPNLFDPPEVTAILNDLQRSLELAVRNPETPLEMLCPQMGGDFLASAK